MSQPMVTIKNQKQKFQLHVNQMSVYKQGKIIQCSDDHNQNYYMFFFKDQYLNIVKANPLKDGSYAQNAFHKGVTFHAPHPLIDATISTNECYSQHLFNDLFSKLKKQHKYHDLVLISTFFESFIKKEQLIRFIKTLFYEDRRNGKMFACYRMYRILHTFAPDHSWTRSLASTLEFKQYAPLYEHPNKTLKEKDPIFYENVLFEQLQEVDAFHKLSQFLQEQNRWIDDIAISIKKFENKPSEWYPLVRGKIEHHFKQDDFLMMLEGLYAVDTTHPQLQQDLLNSYIQINEPAKVLKLMASQKLTLQEKQRTLFKQMVDRIDLESSSVSLEELNEVIASLFHTMPQQADSLLQKAVHMLLKQHKVSFVQQWLQPLRGISEAVPLIRKVDRMDALEDEPDQQYELGELYYEFGQFDEAIECFSWEMELHDQNPKPVQWLSKIYNELGMAQEAKAYQKLYVDMVSA